jgi:hypothetical protein
MIITMEHIKHDFPNALDKKVSFYEVFKLFDPSILTLQGGVIVPYIEGNSGAPRKIKDIYDLVDPSDLYYKRDDIITYLNELYLLTK